MFGFARKYYVWWEYVLQILIPAFIATVIYFIGVNQKNWDIEWWSDTCVELRHEESYETEETRSYSCNCSTDSDGRESCSTCYEDYCSDHPEQWYAISSLGWLQAINEAEYHLIRKKWNALELKIGTIGDEECRIGGVYSVNWNGDSISRQIFVQRHRYENDVRFNRVYVPQEYTKEMRYLPILDYYDVDGIDQNHIIGYWSDIADKEKADLILDRHAAKFGPKKREERGQILPLIWIYNDQPNSIARYHRAKHQGGNKNEYSLLIGYNSKTQKIDWYDIVTFTQNGACVNRMKEFMHDNRDNRTASLEEISTEMTKILSNHWERREFTELNKMITFRPSAKLWAFGILFNLIIGALCAFGFMGNDYY